jgi:hypothetical protein
MLHRLVASILMVGAVALIAPSVNAQSKTIEFSGTMPPPPDNCSFGIPSFGKLQPEGRTKLTSAANNGFVYLICLAPANITLSAPIKSIGPSFSPNACEVSLRQESDRPAPVVFSYNSCTGISSPTPVASVTSQNNLYLSMSVAASSGIPVGDYTYAVILSIVP